MSRHVPTLEMLNASLPSGCFAVYAFTPSVFAISLLNGNSVLLTFGLNVPGWEAVIDFGGDQEGLPDGPDHDAEASAVVEWAEEIVREAQKISR